jgi:hypothetical protein
MCVTHVFLSLKVVASGAHTKRVSGEFRIGENIDPILHKLGSACSQILEKCLWCGKFLEGIQHRFDIH